ncbi:MAG: RNA polymerase sigma factor [Bacteroidia bacterium]|nr:RNA polymerase sigma factor [Bacteroidia bacterium]
MSEEQLIQAIQQEPDQFEQLYEAYYSAIFNYVFKRIGEFELSRDIVSEVFLKAYAGISRFRWKGISIKSWLYRIASNEIKLYFRSKKYRPQLFAQTYKEMIFSEGKTPLELEKDQLEISQEKFAQFQRIQAALRELPLKYQEVIALKYFEQMDIEEIMQISGKKKGTVKSLLSRGMKHLKEKLN